MQTVGVRELKNRPTRYLALALARPGLITLPQGNPDLRTRPVAIRGEPISRTVIRDRR